MKILVDSREKNSMVLAELLADNAEVKIEKLQVGDYIIGDIVIERKTAGDFVSSILNKRLLSQIRDLQQYSRKAVLIEGINEEEIKGMHPNAARGMILSLIFDSGIPIIFTKDSSDTAKFLIVLAKRFDKKKQETSLNTKKKPRSLKESQKFILEGFPGIGPATSKELLKKFGTIKRVINASAEEISSIKKMNERKVRKFLEIINKETK